MALKLSKKGTVILVVSLFLVLIPGIIVTVWLLMRTDTVTPDDTGAADCPGDDRFSSTGECVASCEYGCQFSEWPDECRNGCGNACDSICREDEPDDCTCDGTAIGGTRCGGDEYEDRCQSDNGGDTCYWRDTADYCGDEPPEPVEGDCHPNDPSDAYGCNDVRCVYPAVTYCSGSGSVGTCQCISWQTQMSMPGGCSSDPFPTKPTCPAGTVPCNAGEAGCTKDSIRGACSNCSNPTYYELWCKTPTAQSYSCWDTGCTGHSCNGSTCVNDRCINTSCPNDSDCNCDVEEEDSQVSGRVICRDPGQADIVIPNVDMSIIRNATGNTNVSTNANGAYNVMLADNEGFAVRVNALPAGEVSPGVAYTDMIAPPSLNIAARDSAHCNENTTGSYEMCNSSYSDNFTNFNFIYTGCRLQQQSYVCWDTGCTGTGCSDGSACVNDRCINPDCPDESDCECPAESYTCWETGCTGVGCSDGTSCVDDRCVDTDCPTDSDCVCDDVPEEWEIAKDGIPVCIDGDVLYAEVDYTIVVTNSSSEVATLDRVEDEMDSRIDSSWIESGSIEPSYGTVSGNTIIWDLDASTGRFAAGEMKVFSYTLMVPLEEFGQYLNTATGYQISGETFQVDNVEIVNCDQPPLPTTGLFDSTLGKVGAGLLLISVSGFYFMSDGLDKHMFKYVTKTGRVERSRRKFEEKARK